jgi:hypothetical protein
MSDESSSNVFELLKAANVRSAEFRIRDSGLSISGMQVQHALDARGKPALLVPLGPTEEEVTDLESRAISMRTFELGDLAPERYVVVRCEDVTLEGQFALFADDLLRALRVNGTAPGAQCLVTLEKWRNLLEPASSQLLGREEQIGLIAELHVLERLISIGTVAAVATWTGPDRSRHDFASGTVVVEVKGTTSRERLAVQIHGDRQLEPPEGSDLYLYVEQFELNPNGESVTSIVTRIVEILEDARPFLEKLAAVGFRVDDGPSYEGLRLSTLRSKVMFVDSTFPQISRSSLKDERVFDSVTELRYRLDLEPLLEAASDELALSFTARKLGLL